MSIEFSAFAAITALRAQIEDRLVHNEDYQSLKALDKALAEIKSKVPAVLLASVMGATEPGLILSTTPPPRAPSLKPEPAASTTVRAETHSGLMQRLSASFPGTTTVAATPAQPVIQDRRSVA